METILTALASGGAVYLALCLTEKKFVTVYNVLPLPPDPRRMDKFCRNFVFLASGVLWVFFPEPRMIVELGWWALAVWYLVVIANSEENALPPIIAGIGTLCIGMIPYYTVVEPDKFAWLPLVLFVGSGCLVLLRRELKFAEHALEVSGYRKLPDF